MNVKARNMPSYTKRKVIISIAATGTYWCLLLWLQGLNILLCEGVDSVLVTHTPLFIIAFNKSYLMLCYNPKLTVQDVCFLEEKK